MSVSSIALAVTITLINIMLTTLVYFHIAFMFLNVFLLMDISTTVINTANESYGFS